MKLAGWKTLRYPKQPLDYRPEWPLHGYNSPTSSAEVKNAWSHTSTPPYVFTARDKTNDNHKIVPSMTSKQKGRKKEWNKTKGKEKNK
jgi:hypothetical protein